MELEFEKITPIIISIIALAFSIGRFILLSFKNQKKESILSKDEMNFILNRGDKNDPLNTHLPILQESKLIEKAYGFYATREQFNQLSMSLKAKKYDILKIRDIKKFLVFDDNVPSISFESADKMIIWAYKGFLFIIAAIAIWKSWVYRGSDRFSVIILAAAIIALSINYFFLEPYRQAKKVKDILEMQNESK